MQGVDSVEVPARARDAFRTGAAPAAAPGAAHDTRDGRRDAFAADAPAVCAVIVAGGSGTRFGAPGGKQMIELAGRPLLSWTIEAFDRARSIAHIVVVCPDAHRAEMRERAVEPFGFTTPVGFATAGVTRQDSTRAGVAAAPASCAYVAVHDGARPLITPAVIDEVVAALLADPELDGAVCGQPAIDTLKIADTDGVVEDTPDRGRYWCVQTPQVFSVAMMRRAFAVADAEGFTGTDDASLVERAGGRVRCIAGPRDNFKVTVPEDRVLAEAVLRARKLKGGLPC